MCLEARRQVQRPQNEGTAVDKALSELYALAEQQKHKGPAAMVAQKRKSPKPEKRVTAVDTAIAQLYALAEKQKGEQETEKLEGMTSESQQESMGQELEGLTSESRKASVAQGLEGITLESQSMGLILECQQASVRQELGEEREQQEESRTPGLELTDDQWTEF